MVKIGPGAAPALCAFNWHILYAYPITTIVKSNKFHPFLRYAPLCNTKPYAIIFITHSAVNITRNIYSTFS